MKTFKHSGDMGDIIYSLPAIRAVGGGVLYLDVDGGKDEPIITEQLRPIKQDRLRFGEEQFGFLFPLLTAQDYIKDVRVWNGEKVDIDLNQWRKLIEQHQCLNITEAHLRWVGKNEVKQYEPWLKGTLADEPYIVVSRSHRFHTNDLFWLSNRLHIEERGIFVGTELEHEVFCVLLGVEVQFKRVENAQEIAKLIAGGHEMWGNQSLPMAIAVGLGVKLFQERAPITNCIFPMRDSQYV